jgi:hypothetical protein
VHGANIPYNLLTLGLGGRRDKIASRQGRRELGGHDLGVRTFLVVDHRDRPNLCVVQGVVLHDSIELIVAEYLAAERLHTLDAVPGRARLQHRSNVPTAVPWPPNLNAATGWERIGDATLIGWRRRCTLAHVVVVERMPLHMPIEVIVAKNLPERLRPVDRVRHRARFQDRRSVPFLVAGPPYVHTGPRRVTVGVHGDCFVGKFRCNDTPEFSRTRHLHAAWSPV